MSPDQKSEFPPLQVMSNAQLSACVCVVCVQIDFYLFALIAPI